MKFRERFARFMAGRYGVDALNQGLMILYFVLLVAGLFWWPITVLGYAALVWLVFRMFSRNIYKRQQENLKYLKVKNKFTGFWGLQKRKWQDRKTHRYRKCPHCKATVRLPFKKGKHTVCCPKCKTDFQVKI